MITTLAVALIVSVAWAIAFIRFQRLVEKELNRLHSLNSDFERREIAYRSLKVAAERFSDADKTMLSFTMIPAEIKTWQLRSSEVGRNSALDLMLAAVGSVTEVEHLTEGGFSLKLRYPGGSKRVMYTSAPETYQEISPLGRFMEYARVPGQNPVPGDEVTYEFVRMV